MKQLWLISASEIGAINPGPSSDSKGGQGLHEKEIRLVIPVYRWKEQSPRVTKDFDFITSLDLIASPEEQERLDNVLRDHAFDVVKENARWQFAKQTGTGQKIILDFHAPSAVENRKDIRSESRRIKPQPSLGQKGIHGRSNPEAVGCELHRFCFQFQKVNVVIPNPVNLALMKLLAMRDRWETSQNGAKSPSEREMGNLQARKHAQDLFRIIAMMTREESSSVDRVLEVLREGAALGKATDIYSRFFQAPGSWGSQVVRGAWLEEDYDLIQSILVNWFGRSGRNWQG